MNWNEERPWGRFKNLLDSEVTKVKLIEVNPRQRLSYQSHRKRKETWIIVKGEALVTLEGRKHKLKVGSVIEIPLGAKHRIQCTSNASLNFIEVQTGTYFGEDDIERFEDDFGRLR